MKYGVAWLLGVPFSVIVLWFAANQMGVWTLTCGACPQAGRSAAASQRSQWPQASRVASPSK